MAEPFKPNAESASRHSSCTEAPVAPHSPRRVSRADVRDAMTGLACGLARSAALLGQAFGAQGANLTPSERPWRNADHVAPDAPANAARAGGVRILARLAIGQQCATHARLDVLARTARTLEMGLARLTVRALRRAYTVVRLSAVEAQSASTHIARTARRPVRAIIQAAPRALRIGADHGIERAFILAIVVRRAPCIA